MTWIQTVPEGEATGALKEVYDAWIKLLGFVPNIVKSTSLRAEFTQKFEALRLAITFGGSRLGRRKEELIALVVSVLNKCHYWAVAHGEFLRRAMGDDGTAVVAIASNWRAASLREDERTMLAFAEKLTVAPHTIMEADVAGLRAAGFSDLDILDITLLTCYRHFINRLGDALGVELDEAFKKDGRLVAGIEAAMGVREA